MQNRQDWRGQKADNAVLLEEEEESHAVLREEEEEERQRNGHLVLHTVGRRRHVHGRRRPTNIDGHVGQGRRRSRQTLTSAWKLKTAESTDLQSSHNLPSLHSISYFLLLIIFLLKKVWKRVEELILAKNLLLRDLGLSCGIRVDDGHYACEIGDCQFVGKGKTSFFLLCCIYFLIVQTSGLERISDFSESPHLASYSITLV